MSPAVLVRFGIISLLFLSLSQHAVKSHDIPSEVAQSSGSGSGERPRMQESTDARGDCPDVEHSLTALMPLFDEDTTLLGHPTLWFYVPYSQGQIQFGKFILQVESDEDIDIIFQMDFTLPTQTPGFVSITLPDSAPELEIGQFYHWYFELYCDPDEPLYVDVHGWIQRTEMSSDLEDQLSRSPLRLDQVLLEQEIWYDAIAQLASLRLAEIDNSALRKDWNTSLQKLNPELPELPSGPFLGSVEAENMSSEATAP